MRLHPRLFCFGNDTFRRWHFCRWKKHMKVTFVLPQLCLSGGMRVIAIYAKNLQLRGHDVSLVSKPGMPTSWRSKCKSLIRGKGWPKQRQANPAFFEAAGIPVTVLKASEPITDDDVPDADVIVVCFWNVARWIDRLRLPKRSCVFCARTRRMRLLFSVAGACVLSAAIS